jgi:hypothetical protein
MSLDAAGARAAPSLRKVLPSLRRLDATSLMDELDELKARFASIERRLDRLCR